jgi:hypothetical protein
MIPYEPIRIKQALLKLRFFNHKLLNSNLIIILYKK